MAEEALRVLAFAVKTADELDDELSSFAGGSGEEVPAVLKDPTNFADVESGLTLCGLAGMQDPPRKEVRLGLGPSCAVLCSAVLCCALLCSALLCCALLESSALSSPLFSSPLLASPRLSSPLLSSHLLSSPLLSSPLPH